VVVRGRRPADQVGDPQRPLLCVIGPPGAGKTSQGAALAPLLGARHLSAGELVRVANAAGEKVPRDPRERGLVDPKWMIGRLGQHAGECGLLIIDGYPRAPSHLEGLSALGRLRGVIRIHIDLDRAIDRMRVRGRDGETLARFASRWNRHRNREAAVIEALDAHGIRIADVDGTGEMAQVTERVHHAARELLGVAG